MIAKYFSEINEDFKNDANQALVLRYGDVDEYFKRMRHHCVKLFLITVILAWKASWIEIKNP